MSEDNIPQPGDVFAAQKRMGLAVMVAFVCALGTSLWVLMAFDGLLGYVVALGTFVAVLVAVSFVGSVLAVSRIA